MHWSGEIFGDGGFVNLGFPGVLLLSFVARGSRTGPLVC